VLAIVPVKGRDGKSRLAPALSPGERRRLVHAMLADVLAACRTARAVSAVLVVTPDEDLVPDDVDVLLDDGIGHGEAVARGLADDRARDAALVVMADCPLASADALDRLAASAEPVALVPARDGGMNALALRTPVAFRPAFGVPHAADVTAARARAAGLQPVILDDPRLAFDVDVARDVWRLRRHAPGSRARAALAAGAPAQRVRA
jgi:2-phospho-L-lactate/phosphoenolpyruvate guanylyltransferase